MNAVVEITLITKADGPLTKRIALDAEDKMISDGAACVMSAGTAGRVALRDLGDLAEQLSKLRNSEAITLGALRPNLPDCVEITTKRRLASLNGAAPRNLIARTAEFFGFWPERHALALLDYDTKGMPEKIRERIADLGGFWPALETVLPELRTAAHVIRRSTSAGIYNAATHTPIKGSDGIHAYVLIADGTDSERFLKTLHARCWLSGLGWMLVGAGGQLLERSIVDRMVSAPERLVFEGPPILEPPLAQDAASRGPIAMDGNVVDTVALCPPLTIVEHCHFKVLIAKEAHQLASEAIKAREHFVARHAQELAERTGVGTRFAAKVIERQCAGVLLPDLILPFDDPDHAGATVADVLARISHTGF